MNKIALLMMLFLGLATDGFGATITRYVNPGSSGGDGTTSALSGANAAYVSLSAFEAAEQADLDTANNLMEVNCAGATTDTTAAIFVGWTTSATDYIKIIGDNTTGIWDTSKYRLIASVTGAGVLSIQEEYFRIDKLQIQNNNTPASGNDCAIEFLPSVATNNVLWCSNSFFRGGRFTFRMTSSNISNVNIWNSLCYGPSIGAIAFANANHIAKLYSDFFIGGSGYGVYDPYNITETIKNCYAYASGSGVAYSGVTNFTTSASDDTTGTLDNIPYDTTTFTNVTGSSEDLHLVSGSGLIDVGTDTSGDAAPLNFTDDIDGVTRSGTWDIGADEFVAAGGARRVIFIQ